eukprot:2008737-Rhodomonas_salina.1
MCIRDSTSSGQQRERRGRKGVSVRGSSSKDPHTPHLRHSSSSDSPGSSCWTRLAPAQWLPHLQSDAPHVKEKERARVSSE